MLTETRKLLDHLAATPLLMKQHKGLPSVVSLVTGEDLNHSWWSHPQSHLLFRVMNELSGHADVLMCKLLFRKDTFLHRQLFAALLAAVEAEDSAILDSAARRLLARVASSKTPLAASGAAAKQLILQVRVRAFEVHTEHGRHELRLESWQRWASRAGIVPMASAADGRAALEAAARALGASSAALPFQRIKS